MPTAPTISKKEKKENTKRRSYKKRFFLILSLSLIVLISTSFAVFNYYFYERIFPGVKVAGVNIGGLKRSEAESIINDNLKIPEKLDVRAKEKTFDLSLPGIGFSYNTEKSLDEAYLIYRTGEIPQKYVDQILSFKNEKVLGLKININTSELEKYIQVISDEVAEEPVLPSVTLQGKNIVIDKGSPGEFPDVEAFKKKLINNLSERNYETVELQFIQDDSSLTEEESVELFNRAVKLSGKSLTLENEFDVFTLKEKEVFTFLNGKGDYNQDNVEKYIDDQITPRVNREPQNAVFKFEDGKVLEFKPAKSGLTVNKEKLKQELINELEKLETENKKTASIKIPVESKSADITTDKVNDLGIKELIGRGSSKFAGSIASRMHNIAHAASKFNGVLVPPGADFSFNDTLGDVSTLTGYKQAYVIRDGRTVLGDGGGVCQVSSTLFRAILNAGLPITERRAHSYRVGYYEQDVGPGLDATVFAPTTDLKFKNDTPGHLLIQTQYDGKTASLVFEIYGTSDGRKITTTKPVILSQTKPPDDQYIDDPTLPAGQIKQVEHKAWGAKVSFDHKVERNGEIIFQKTFLSSYRPWGAVFMRGTGPAI